MHVAFHKGRPLKIVRTEFGMRKLISPLPFWVNGVRHAVPKGFESDLSSIPCAFAWIVRFDRVDVAGVVHDWLYFSGKTSRRKADAIWRTVAMLGPHRASPVQAWVCWAGLRLGGWIAWGNYRK
jgi:hypothetical protein